MNQVPSPTGKTDERNGTICITVTLFPIASQDKLRGTIWSRFTHLDPV